MQEAAHLDRARIQTLLELTRVFSPEEVQCALSLFDVYCEKGADPNEYVFYCVYDSMQTVLGFLCYGKASLTDLVYDLYWIVTDPDYQGQGVGSLLMRTLDERVKHLGARMVLAETSSRVDYEGTRRFYLKRGYQPICVIKDYYARGDDLIVFQKNYQGVA